jgi:hypothetical protein
MNSTTSLALTSFSMNCSMAMESLACRQCARRCAILHYM